MSALLNSGRSDHQFINETNGSFRPEGDPVSAEVTRLSAVIDKMTVGTPVSAKHARASRIIEEVDESTIRSFSHRCEWKIDQSLFWLPGLCRLDVVDFENAAL